MDVRSTGPFLALHYYSGANSCRDNKNNGKNGDVFTLFGLAGKNGLER